MFVQIIIEWYKECFD